MVTTTYFERLVETAEMIARHADYPGKGRVVAQCCQEVEDLTLTGQISEDQSEVLLSILRAADARRV